MKLGLPFLLILLLSLDTIAAVTISLEKRGMPAVAMKCISLTVPLMKSVMNSIVCQHGRKIVLKLTTDGSFSREFLLETVNIVSGENEKILSEYAMKKLSKRAVDLLIGRMIDRWTTSQDGESSSTSYSTTRILENFNNPEADLLVDLDKMEFRFRGETYSLTELPYDYEISNDIDTINSITENHQIEKSSDEIVCDLDKMELRFGEHVVSLCSDEPDESIYASDSDDNDGYFTADEEFS